MTNIQEIYWTIMNSKLTLTQLASMEIDLKEELYNSELWKSLKSVEKEIFEIQDWIKQQENQIKDLMIQNDVKKIELNDKIFTLKKSPWALSIEDENVIPLNYFIEKTTRSVDKKAVKEAVENWLLTVPWVEIKHSYSLLITEKLI